MKRKVYSRTMIMDVLQAAPGTIVKETDGHIIFWPAPALYLLPVGRSALVFSYAGRVGDEVYYHERKYAIAADGCKLPQKYRDVLAGIENYVRR